jgi:hypothetical protein
MTQDKPKIVGKTEDQLFQYAVEAGEHYDMVVMEPIDDTDTRTSGSVLRVTARLFALQPRNKGLWEALEIAALRHAMAVANRLGKDEPEEEKK